MKAHLKSLEDQVIVITGASSGIGLATARAAALQGARLVLAARSVRALDQIVQDIEAGGGDAIAVECDVGDRRQVERVAQAAIERFGRIDTWVNDAGASIYGMLEEVRDDDNRRLFDTNFWGVVYGSLAALPHLKRSRGALINIGSEVSEGYIPLLGMYTASKHAVKGFTDSLRVEIEQVEKAPVAITLIQPTSVNTPFPQHACNYMEKEPSLPTPMIEPEKVADAILKAATQPTRDIRVGTAAKINTLMAKLIPALADHMAAGELPGMKSDLPPRRPRGALFEPSETTGVVGRTHGSAELKPQQS